MKSPKIKKQKRSFSDHGLTADYWAVATIVALPVTMFAASRVGVSSVSAFFVGMLGSLAVLVLNACMEGRLWMFSSAWRGRFESPDFSFRLAVVSGVLFLMLETSLLFIFFTSPSLDRSLMQMVFARHCAYPRGDYMQICDVITEEVLSKPETIGP